MSKTGGASGYCFYFPYHEDSGVPTLFARLANNIATRYPDKEITIIDYKNGAIIRNTLSLSNIKLIEFIDGSTVTPPADCILIMQSFVPYYWPKELKVLPETRVYFWNLHPKNFIPSLLPIQAIRDITFNIFGLYKLLALPFSSVVAKLRGFVNLLIKHKALSFMDQTNYDTTIKYLFMNDFETELLPVPASPSKISFKKNALLNPDELNFCWVGRLCDFKAYILVYTANELAKIAKTQNKKINYHIIGGGPFRNYIEESIAENEFFKVHYLGVLLPAKVDEFIIQNVDVMTAMGTSALESAKFGVPTILLDFSYAKINGDYLFRWLYQTKNFDLGHAISKEDIINNNTSLSDMIHTLLANYPTECDKTYNYFIANHSIENIADKFIRLADQSTLLYGEIDQKYFRKPLPLALYNKLRKVDI